MGHVSISTRFTFLMLDLHYIVSVYLNQKYAYLKNIRLCANMLVKGLFTSDTEYEPGISATEARKLGLMSHGPLPVPREMAFHVPKGSCWNDFYDMLKFPAKSKHFQKGVIHAADVNFNGKEKGMAKSNDLRALQTVPPSFQSSFHSWKPFYWYKYTVVIQIIFLAWVLHLL